MTKDENPIKICWYCKKKFDGNFEIHNFSIICPYCKRPQSSVFEEDSQAQIIKRSKDSIKKSKAEFKKSQTQTSGYDGNDLHVVGKTMTGKELSNLLSSEIVILGLHEKNENYTMRPFYHMDENIT